MAVKQKLKDAWDTVSGDKDVVGAVVQLLVALGKIVVRTVAQQSREEERNQTE
jgi:hypothetical protein